MPRISELPTIASVSPTDEMPIVDQDLNATGKITLEQLVPSGGTAGQVLVKQSADPFDYDWEDVLTLQGMGFTYEETLNTEADYAAAGALNIVPYNTLRINTITGAALNLGTGKFTLPVGTFHIQASINPKTSNGAVLMLYNDTDLVYEASGPVNENDAANSSSVVLLDTILTVATSAKEFSLILGVGDTVRMGTKIADVHIDYVNEVSSEVYAHCTIIKY